MSDAITIEKYGRKIDVGVRKSHRAKRVIIRISPYKGVELVIPKRVSFKRAEKFLQQKKEWVFAQLDSLKDGDDISFVEGTVVKILDNEYTIKHSGKLRGVTKIEGENIVISGDKMQIRRKAKDFLKSMAKDEIAKNVEDYAKKIGAKYNKITIRDTSSRWGSCSRGGNLSFSWRLIMAPGKVLQYVAAHEVAHLLKMDHSQEFWGIVSDIFPDYKKYRLWLKKNGSQLHKYEPFK